jgi:phosphoribosylglycinamide formyltransferase-1
VGVSVPDGPLEDPSAGLRRPLRVGVLVSGSGTNLQAVLDAAGPDAPFGIVKVISNVPGVRALERAAAVAVPSEVVDHRRFPDRKAFEDALLSSFHAADVEVVVLAGFMRLLTRHFLDAFPLRTLNVHPALCPAFPGVDAPRQAIAWGVAITGCTVHFVDAGTDTGPIIAQAAVPVHPEDDAARLHARIQREEHRLLPLALRWFAEGRLRVDGRRVRVLPDADDGRATEGASWPSTSTR